MSENNRDVDNILSKKFKPSSNPFFNCSLNSCTLCTLVSRSRAAAMLTLESRRRIHNDTITSFKWGFLTHSTPHLDTELGAWPLKVLDPQRFNAFCNCPFPRIQILLAAVTPVLVEILSFSRGHPTPRPISGPNIFKTVTSYFQIIYNASKKNRPEKKLTARLKILVYNCSVCMYSPQFFQRAMLLSVHLYNMSPFPNQCSLLKQF